MASDEVPDVLHIVAREVTSIRHKRHVVPVDEFSCGEIKNAQS